MICKNCGVNETEGRKTTCSEECHKELYRKQTLEYLVRCRLDPVKRGKSNKRQRDGHIRRMQDPAYREKMHKQISQAWKLRRSISSIGKQLENLE